MRDDFTFSDQQFAAITAPLEPAVVIAGAGSGKTTVMAARVVWLVATGQVTPDQVLGLTFTTKAAGELATRDPRRAAGRRLGSRRAVVRDRRRGREEILEPTVATYNAYAASLLTEHGLRIGHEPDTSVIADASRYQLAARAVARYTAPIELLSDHPRHVDQLHARSRRRSSASTWSARRRARVPRRASGRCSRRRWPPRPQDRPARDREGDHRDRPAGELLGLVEAYRALKRQLGLMDFSDQIALGAQLAERAARGRRGRSATSSGSCCSTSTRTPRSPRR